MPRAFSLVLPIIFHICACSSSSTPAATASGGVPSGGSAGAAALGGGGSNAAGGGSTGLGGASGAGASAGGSTSGGGGNGTLSAPIAIVTGGGVDVPYQFDANTFGIQGAAFFAQSAMGTSSIVLDKTQAGKICVKGTVEAVPTPPDGSHPPYSSYWGIDLGFNLNQSPTADPTVKTPWLVPAGVVGFWFTVEGAMIPPIRFKTTPTGKDPAQEQDSCALVTPASGVQNTVLFSNMYVQCWDGPQGTAPNDVSMGLLDVGLQVAATTEAIPVDFCLTGFGVVSN